MSIEDLYIDGIKHLLSEIVNCNCGNKVYDTKFFPAERIYIIKCSHCNKKKG